MSNLHPVFVEIFEALGMPQGEPAVSAERAARLRALAYVEDLQRHDWLYEFSDDHSVWKRGVVEQHRLRGEQAAIDPRGEVWNRYCHPDQVIRSDS